MSKEDLMAKGIGGVGNLLKQAQEMQARISKIQEELGQKTVDGSAGGGMVQVTVNGQLNLCGLKIDPSVITSEEKVMFEELSFAAGTDGMSKVREWVSDEMSNVKGRLKLL